MEMLSELMQYREFKCIILLGLLIAAVFYLLGKYLNKEIFLREEKIMSIVLTIIGFAGILLLVLLTNKVFQDIKQDIGMAYQAGYKCSSTETGRAILGKIIESGKQNAGNH